MERVKALVADNPMVATALGVWLAVAAMLVLLSPDCVMNKTETANGTPVFSYDWRTIAVLASLAVAAWYFAPMLLSSSE